METMPLAARAAPGGNPEMKPVAPPMSLFWRNVKKILIGAREEAPISLADRANPLHSPQTQKIVKKRGGRVRKSPCPPRREKGTGPFGEEPVAAQWSPIAANLNSVCAKDAERHPDHKYQETQTSARTLPNSPPLARRP